MARQASSTAKQCSPCSQLPPKLRIAAEAARLLKSGGRYGIHELCLVPDDVDQATRDAVQRGLSGEIHVGVRPLTACEWRTMLASAGLTVVAERMAPMHLLELPRLVRDEGLLARSDSFGMLPDILLHVGASRRMRKAFRQHRDNLAAIALVATKPLD